MPNPFPGVDPYLESTSWESFHAMFVTELARQLNRRLSSDLLARPEERCYVTSRYEQPRRQIKPDTTIAKHVPVLSASGGSVAVRSLTSVEAAQPTGILHRTEEQVTEHYLEIRRIRKGNVEEPVITVVELLSPTNKTEAHNGRESYLKKQIEVLQSFTNLVEIDLLRGGSHTVCADKSALDEFGLWDHVITLSRVERSREISFYLNRLRDLLPSIRIPLRAGEDDVILDLQALYSTCYQDGRFDETDYTTEPEPPFSPDDAQWADTLLREKGLR